MTDSLHVMVHPLPNALRTALEQDLRLLMVALHERGDATAILNRLLTSMMPLPPAAVNAVERLTRNHANAAAHEVKQRGPLWFWQMPVDGVSLVESLPQLAWVWLFHGNGYCREAALKALPAAPLSAFFLTALFWRANDNVAQVRAAAEWRLEAELAHVSPAVATEVGLFVLGRLADWKRLSPRAAGFVESLFRRADVREDMLRRLLAGGHESRTADMKACMRFDVLDDALGDLAAQSASAAIRRLALRILVNGHAEIPHAPHVVADKLAGRYKLVRNTEQRTVPTFSELPSLIRGCLADRSAMVRRIAADGLILKRAQFRDVDELAQVLLADRNASIRERGAFLLRTDSHNKPRQT